MVSRIIFTINVDIDESNLDNPGWWNGDGTQASTDKSKITKQAFLEWSDKIILNQSQYAYACKSNYRVHLADSEYSDFYNTFKKDHPQISEYDIINFYKHWLMKKYSSKFDEVCYVDLDVVFNTKQNIFESHDIYNKFACGEQNSEALFGKTVRPYNYNLCIRNPASKYWNTFAMLLDSGYTKEESDTDVFNTGIMIASREQIQKLNYFDKLDDIIRDMEYLKEDHSIFHPNIVRSFNYDNETIFAYKRVVNEVEIDYIDEDWHQRVLDNFPYMEDSKVFHVISKKFELFSHILGNHV